MSSNSKFCAAEANQRVHILLKSSSLKSKSFIYVLVAGAQLTQINCGSKAKSPPLAMLLLTSLFIRLWLRSVVARSWLLR